MYHTIAQDKPALKLYHTIAQDRPALESYYTIAQDQPALESFPRHVFFALDGAFFFLCVSATNKRPDYALVSGTPLPFPLPLRPLPPLPLPFPPLPHRIIVSLKQEVRVKKCKSSHRFVLKQEKEATLVEPSFTIEFFPVIGFFRRSVGLEVGRSNKSIGQLVGRSDR